jgi:methylmalonyl-CoA mutase cobalamin-binding subunit
VRRCETEEERKTKDEDDEEERTRELQRELAALRERAAQELARKDAQIEHWRREVETMRRFERRDAVHEVVEKGARLVDIDPVRAAERLSGATWTQVMARHHRTLVPDLIRWLQEYHAAVVRMIGPEPPDAHDLRTRRALRALDAGEDTAEDEGVDR